MVRPSSGGHDDDFDGADAGATDAVPNAQEVLQGLLVNLPDEARSIVEKADREVAKLRKQAERKAAQTREKAERRALEIEGEAEQRCQALLQEASQRLAALQGELTQAGELEKALATLVQIQALRSRAMNVLPDPGSLVQFQEVGKSFYFEVVGSNHGPLWGTDVYTADSSLAVAAVHAGALKLREQGIVRVTIVDMSKLPVKGSLRHGVRSADWGSYPVGYRVARA